MKEQLKMFALTLRHLNGRDQGIQGGHAIIRYGREHKNKKLYGEQADYPQSIILLEAPTEEAIFEAENQLRAIGVDTTLFSEPDLGDLTTGLAFIADAEMWDSTNFPIEAMRGKKQDRIAEFRRIKKQFPLASS